MKASASHPVIRVPALLFSVAVVGCLIGFAWERVAYRNAPVDGEWEPPAQPGHGEAGATRGGARTPGEEAVLKRALSHFPPYPRASRPEVLASDYLGPGVPMAVAWFSTKDTPAQVMEHYAKALLEKGLPVLRQVHGEKGGYVGYWSPATMEVRLVSALEQGGETLVFVSAGQVHGLLERAIEMPAWVPLPGELTDLRAMSFEMEGATHHAVSGQLPEETLGGAEARYRAVLREKGWAMGATEPLEPKGVSFEVSQGVMQGRAVLRERPSQPGVEVQLSLLQRGAAP
ncbi:hypothetical protein [Myxococcus sp. RHSTA-1-4]|uniref:hypothetical protein n=1 Tax=Myxococcus sp. RHSTA-1-4 TaxID=2874601 RepID=UPI001CBAA832|nr:hypothetical protein [Myxococcus sp. RHSTA-1-4]MBZ4415125.1 hypothetical protein [Myxococcus sp. RHSTA-1-4]